MNPEVKEKWVEALRSGDYKQGAGALCQIDKRGEKYYCCLGVLTDLYAKTLGEDANGKWVRFEEENETVFFGWEKEGTRFSSKFLLSPVVVDWAELPENDPTIWLPMTEEDISLNTLSELNDDLHDFEEIANIIEEYL